MSRLPSPFQNDLPKMLNSCSSSPSHPGFLLMTRPANITSDLTGRSLGRANNRGGYHVRHQHSYSNSSPNYASFRNQDQKGGYKRGSYSPRFLGHKQKSLPTPSPNRDFYGNAGNSSFSGLPSFQSTPNSSFNSSRGASFNRSHHFNANRSKHDTPLKDIPVDKFVSRKMILDPWESFPLDAPSAQNESLDIDVPKEVDGALTDEGTSTNDESVSTTDSPLGYSTLSDRDNDSDSEI